MSPGRALRPTDRSEKPLTRVARVGDSTEPSAPGPDDFGESIFGVGVVGGSLVGVVVRMVSTGPKFSFRTIRMTSRMPKIFGREWVTIEQISRDAVPSVTDWAPWTTPERTRWSLHVLGRRRSCP